MQRSLRSTIESANEQLIATGDRASVESFFSPEYVVHIAGKPLVGGPDLARRYIQMLQGAFSNIEVLVEILIENGDRVAWQRTVTGTQTGSYKGFPATGRTIRWRDMVVSRFEGGLITEEWVVTDLAEQLLVGRKGGPINGSPPP